MCGIAGAYAYGEPRARLAVERMCDQMHPRGPDDRGVATLDGAHALGACRLAIIDPSPAGHQPMVDEDRGTTIVFNGMIYNFRELRDRLEADGERFRSDCDTEVVLRAYGRYGPDCVRHLRGMFAFAIWDERRRRLLLARDRLGIKPLYYRRDGARLLFASQVKALLHTGLVPRRLSPPAVQTYLAFGAVSEPLTAVDGVLALPAAHVGVVEDGKLALRRYWEPPERPDLACTREEAARELRSLLTDVVRRHLISDAPLGVFLSGGLDSSALACLAARETDRLRTVSVVFDDEALSEERYIDVVARSLAADHVRVPLRASELLESLGSAFDAMDQPSFDGVNTFVVSRAAAATGLKVALSGLGGDELFDGYGYARRVSALERVRRLPAPMRGLGATAAGAVLRDGRGEKLRAWLADGADRGSSYDLLRRLFLDREIGRLAGAAAASDGVPPPPRVPPGGDVYSAVSLLDLTNYTKNVLLRDTDAMSMANSLEVRVPFLDHVLVEWSLRLPGGVKAAGRSALFEAALGDLVPREVFARRKHGFLLPLAGWMRNELREDVDETLRRPPDEVAALLEPERLVEIWADYRRTGRRWLRPWALYALCRWCETARAGVPVPA